MTDRLLATTVAVAAFAIYAAGACRTIYVGDSGELVAAAWTLGIPHPTGYPLYVLLGKLWATALPFGSVAFRLSLFSAFGAALAVGLVFLAARALAVRPIAALAAAALFAASPSFWGEANVQRVYALNAGFVALALLLAIRWDRSLDAPAAEEDGRRDRIFVALAFTCGLGAANHAFLALLGAVVLLYALLRDRGLARRVATLGRAALAALAGLSVYVYLPWRSRQEPRLDWGNPETFDAFVDVVTRRDFWSRRWWTGWHDLPPIVADYVASFARELTPAGAVVAAAGLLVARRRRIARLLAAVALANLAVMAAHGSRADLFVWHRYYVPSYLAAALLAALGLEAGLAALAARRPRLATTAGGAALAATLLLVPFRFGAFDRSGYAIAESYSRTLLASLPPGGHLAASDDNILFVLLYLQQVERVRPDVDLIAQGVGGELPPLVFDPDRAALFFTHHPNWQLAALDVVPVGLAYRVVRAGRQSEPLPLARQRLEGEDDPRVPKDYLTRNLIGEFHFMLGVTHERRDRARALAELAAAARAAPDNDVLFYNLGLVYDRMGLGTAALAAFERSAAINPRPLPGPARVRAADKVAELRGRAAPGVP